MADTPFDLSLFDTDPEMYEYSPGYWLMGATFPRDAVDAARAARFKESDILTATFPKTGEEN